MAKNCLGTVLYVLAQRRKHAVTGVASFVVPNVAQRIRMQAGALCNDSEASVLKLRADQFKCEHSC